MAFPANKRLRTHKVSRCRDRLRALLVLRKGANVPNVEALGEFLRDPEQV